jgi:excisionase family DNA binding protein
VARRLGVSRTWLYAAAKDGRIPSIRIGGPDGPLRFVPADLDVWLDQARGAWRPGDTSAATLRRLADAGVMATGVYEYELGDGSARFYVRYRTSNGVQRMRRGFRSEREAVRWRTQTMAAVYRGEIVAVSGTFAERFDAWLDEHRPRIEPGTTATTACTARSASSRSSGR